MSSPYPAPDLASTPRLRAVLAAAEQQARQRGHTHLGVEHLMLAILAEGASVPAGVLQRRGLSLPELYADLDAVVATYSSHDGPEAGSDGGSSSCAAGP